MSAIRLNVLCPGAGAAADGGQKCDLIPVGDRVRGWGEPLVAGYHDTAAEFTHAGE